MQTVIQKVTTTETIVEAFNDKRVIVRLFSDNSGEFEFAHKHKWYEWTGFTFDFEFSCVAKTFTVETSMSVTQVIRETATAFSMGKVLDHEDEEVFFSPEQLKVVAEAIEYELNTK